jgi:hypothetical protein
MILLLSFQFYRCVFDFIETRVSRKFSAPCQMKLVSSFGDKVLFTVNTFERFTRSILFPTIWVDNAFSLMHIKSMHGAHSKIAMLA